MKILVNEIQLDILQKLLTEAKYQDVITSVKKGDELKLIDRSNNELIFSVLLNDKGGLYLKSLVRGSVYINDFFFMDLKSLNKDMLTLKRVNTPSDIRNEKSDLKRLKKVLLKFPLDDWKSISFKKINEMFLSDEDIDLDKYETEQKESIKNYTEVTDAGEINDLLTDFNSFKEGSKYNFRLIDGGTIWADLITNQGGSLTFEVMPQGLMGSAANYKDLDEAQIRLDVNSKNIKKFEFYDKDKDETMIYYNITFKSLLGGEGRKSEKTITVKYIKDINLVSASPKKEKKKKENKKPDIDKMSGVDITNYVLDDPRFNNAFNKRPGFLKSLLGVKPTGLIAAKKILNKWFSSTYYDTPEGSKELLSKFINNQSYNIKIKDKSFKRGNVYIDINKTYTLKAFKQRTTSNIQKPFLKGDGYVVKINSRIEDSNDYRVTIIVNSDNYQENRTMTIKNLY